MCAAREYTLATGDDCLMEDTLALYAWRGEYMIRSGTKVYENGLSGGQCLSMEVNDKLYWMDFNVDCTGRDNKTYQAGAALERIGLYRCHTLRNGDT